MPHPPDIIHEINPHSGIGGLAATRSPIPLLPKTTSRRCANAVISRTTGPTIAAVFALTIRARRALGDLFSGRIWQGSDDDLHILQPGSSARARCNRSRESAGVRREAANPIATKPVSCFWFLTFSGNFQNIRHKD